MLVKTTKLPSRKMTVKDSFCERLVCSFHTYFIGNAKMKISVMMLGTETARKVTRMLIQ